MKQTSVFLALDVGGTHVRAAVVDGEGRILQEERICADLSRLQASCREEAELQVLDCLLAAVAPLRRCHPHIQALGVGFPGFFRKDSGVLAASPNLPQLRDFDLAGRLAQRLGLPVAVQNDALAAAVGEWRFGSGRGLSDLLHLTLGTGVGGGLILNSRPFFGESGMAAEIGHLCVQPQGRRCGCGNRGCLEAYASAESVAARYAESGGKHAATAADVERLAEQGDDLALKILAEAGMHLGRAVANAVNLLDVHHVSFSGGLTGAWRHLHPALQASLNEGLIPPHKGRVRLLRTSLEDHAGLLGAAALALTRVRG